MPAAVEPPIRSELRIQSICLAVLSVVAVGFALWWLKPVLIPFVMAAFLAFALMPLVDFLEVRCRMPRAAGVCLAMLLAVMALVGIGVLIEVSVNQITGNVEQYQERVEQIVKWAANLPVVIWFADRTPTNSDDATKAAPNGPAPAMAASKAAAANAATSKSATPQLPMSAAAATAEVKDAIQNAQTPKEKTEAIQMLTSDAVRTFLLGATGIAWTAAWGIVTQSVLVLVFVFFLLMSSAKRDRPIGGAWGEMEVRIRSYIITMTLLCGVTGVLVGVVLAIIGVQAAVLFGFLAFLLNFIPSVGSAIATLLPVPLVLLGDFSNFEIAMAIGLPGVIQFFIGSFVQPKLMGDNMQLHPVVILISLIFWGTLWGIVGMFLAVPITSIIRIVCDRHPLTKPIANLMAGRLDSLREEPMEKLIAEAAEAAGA